jgi:putative membrane protein
MRRKTDMLRTTLLAAVCLLAVPAAAAAQSAKPSDAQIAHIAYTAGSIDIVAGKQALAKSHDKAVRMFAQEMIRDHGAVNEQALALVKKLGVTPQDNPTSASLQAGGKAKFAELAKLNGKAFDRAYVRNEVAYHKTVTGALQTTLIPSAQNGELKGFLETGLKLFLGHLDHAEMLAGELK